MIDTITTPAPEQPKPPSELASSTTTTLDQGGGGDVTTVKTDLKLNDPQSTIFGVSVRAWIVVEIMTTVCAMAVFEIQIEEPLYSLALLAAGFYFGQKTSKP